MGTVELVDRYRLVEAGPELDFAAAEEQAEQTYDLVAAGVSVVETCRGNRALERWCQAVGVAAAAAVVQKRGMWWGGFPGHRERPNTVTDGLYGILARGEGGN